MIEGVFVHLDANFEQRGEVSIMDTSLVLLLRGFCVEAAPREDDGGTVVDAWGQWLVLVALRMLCAVQVNRFFSELTLWRGEQNLLRIPCQCVCVRLSSQPCCYQGLESGPLSLQELSLQDCLTYPRGVTARSLNEEADSAMANWKRTGGPVWLKPTAAHHHGSCDTFLTFCRGSPFPLKDASSPMRLDNAPPAPD